MKLSKHIYILVVSLLRELSALRGYHILYSERFGYFFTKNFDSDNVTSIKTIPVKNVYCQRWESLTVFYSRNRAKFPYYDSILLKKEQNLLNNNI